MKINNIKRIVTEDFPADSQETMGKLAFALNPFLEQVSLAFSKNIDFDNLNQEVKTFDITVDASGNPLTSLELSYSLKTRPQGIIVINAINISGTAGYPTSCPFISYDFNNNNIRILNVAGLPANKKFTLRVILIG